MKQTTAGYSLIEVLVALAVIAVALGITFEAFTQSVRLRVRSERLLEASRVVRRILADDALIERAMERGEVSGNLLDEESWKYLLLAKPLNLQLARDVEPVEIPRMCEVRICVFREGGDPKSGRCLVSWFKKK